MSNQFILPVLVFIRPSLYLKFFIYGIHAGALPAVFAANLSWSIRCLLLGVLIISLMHAIWTNVLQKNPDSPVQLLLDADDEWWLTTASGQTIRVRLIATAFVHPLLTVLPFRAARGRHAVILTPDAVDTDSFRRLRVRLRFLQSGKMPVT
jgi:hypothetical protein